jgi:phosphoglycolate phosphatase
VGDLHGRLIAFDLDGTLVDSRRDLADSANQLITELGGTPLPEEAIGRMVGEGANVLVERALRAAGVLVVDLPNEGGSDENTDGSHNSVVVASGFSRKALDRFLAIYDDRLVNHTRAYDGIREAVTDAGRHARLAVLTNKPTRATERLLEALDLRPLFDDVIGGDTSWPRKPDPASLQELMRRAGAAARTTLLVGDSAVDHETARRAGAACCLASYGFGFDTFPRERLTGSEWIVRTPAELAGIFTQFTAG